MISVIYTIWDNHAFRCSNFRQSISSIYQQLLDNEDYEIIVVQQNCVYDWNIAKTPADLTVTGINIDGDTPSRSHLRNVGAKAADGDILLFLDADMVCGKDYLTRILEDMHESWQWAMGCSNVIELTIDGTKLCIRKKGYALDYPQQLVARRYGIDLKRSPGRANIFRKEFFFGQLGGYNEALHTTSKDCAAFRAAVLTKKLHELPPVHKIDYTLLHLHHEGHMRTPADVQCAYDSAIAEPLAVCDYVTALKPVDKPIIEQDISKSSSSSSSSEDVIEIIEEDDDTH